MKTFLRSSLLLAALALPGLVSAQAAPDAAPAANRPAAASSLPKLPDVRYVVRGQDFRILAQPQRATPGRTEMLVFFWYGSPWAAKVDPYLNEWVASGRAPANLRLQYVPLALSRDWEFSARIFFALERMGKEREITPRLFRAVQAKAVDLSSPRSVQTWLTEQGIAADAFSAAINDPVVIAKTNALRPIARAYDVRSSPTFVIDGRYHIASTDKVPPERALAVAMFMTQKLSEGGPRP